MLHTKINKTVIGYIILTVIVLLSAYLRLYRISEYLTFLGDEGRDVLIVKKMIVDHKFTLLGPTASVGGFFMGPVYYYFMAPFLWIFRLDPVGPAIMVALVGIMTVVLVYFFTKKISGTYAGLVAASLYALSPLVIRYSRSSWNPNIVPFFSVLLFIFLLKLSYERKSTNYLFVGIFLGIGVQLHYVFLFLFFVAFLWMLYIHFGVIRLKIIQIFWVITGFILGISPFLLFEIRHGFVNFLGIIEFLTKGKETGFALFSFFTTIVWVLIRIFGRLILRMPDQGQLLENTPEFRVYWFLMSMGVVLIVLGWSLWRLKSIKIHQNKIQKQGILLLVMALLAVSILFGFYKKEIHDYYFGIIFVVPFIIIASMLSEMRKNKYLKIISVGLWFVLCWYNLQGMPFKYQPNNQLQQMKNISKKVFEITNGEPFNFALVAANNSDHAYRYFLEIWDNPPVTIENIDNDKDRKTVTDQLIVVCEELDCQPLGHSLWEIAGFGRAQIDGVWDVPFVKIYKLIHYQNQEL